MSYPDDPIGLPHFLAGGVSPSELDDLIEWLNSLVGRVSDSSWASSGITAAGSGASIASVQLRQAGLVVGVRGIVTIGTTITVGSNGNTAETQLAQITDSDLWPGPTQAFGGWAGPNATFKVDNTGAISISSIAPGSTLSASGTPDTIGFSGTYLL